MFYLVLLTILIVLIYIFVVKPLNYWDNLGVASKKPWPILGNMVDTIFRTKSFIELIQDLYNTFPNRRYYGMHQFTKPVFVLRDVDLIKKITVKDFDHFTDHNPLVSDDVDPLMGRNLFFLRGQRWRDMRSTLSPSFTGSKMRSMFVLLSECAEEFTKHFQKQGFDTIRVELKDIFTRFTNDAIASVAFGLKVDSLGERDNEFYIMGKSATNFSGLTMLIKFLIFNVSPFIAKILNLTFFPPEVSKFFKRIVKETIQKREEHGFVRHDMIQLLMEARKGAVKENEQNNEEADSGFAIVQESHVGKSDRQHKLDLSDDDITAQALIFFFGGFESSATLMSLVAYELAVAPDIQKKLQEEINETLEKCKGKLTYEGLMGMKLLDMVLSETLRKWPPNVQNDRVCVKDYTIMPKYPDEVPITIKKGQIVLIPVIGIHRDPKFFQDPDKFDPERFSEANKHNIEPASYMPFGTGPRSCIASRFALLENKTLLFHLLSKFDIIPIKETIIPLKIGKKTFNMVPDEGFWMGLRQRQP